MTTKTVLITSGTTYTIPSDFGSLVSVEGIGRGGNGAAGVSGATPAGGGPGGPGAYAKIITDTGLSPGASIAIQIGTSASAVTTSWNGGSCIADYGRDASGITRGVRGLATNCVGSTTFNGGVSVSAVAASSQTFHPGGSAAGAAGPLGAGQNSGAGTLSGNTALGGGGGGGNGLGSVGNAGTTTTGGNGGNNNGGSGAGTGGTVSSAATAGTAGGGGGGGGGAAVLADASGGNGGPGTEWTITAGGTAGSGGGGGAGGTGLAVGGNGGNGGLYGGAGAGGAATTASAGTGGLGAQGVIIFTYTVAVALPMPPFQRMAA